MSKVSNSMRQSWVKLLGFVAVQMWKECRTCYSPTLIIWTLIISSVYGDWNHSWQTVIFYVYLLRKKAVKKYTTTLKHKHINHFLCWPICILLYYFIHTWCMIVWIPMSWAKGWAVAHEYLLMCIVSPVCICLKNFPLGLERCTFEDWCLFTSENLIMHTWLLLWIIIV